MNVNKFWSWVEQQAASKNITSLNDLEKKTGLSQGTITKRRRDGNLPTVSMAFKLCETLDITWGELWTHAGIEVSQPINQSSNEELLLSHYRQLDNRTQQNVLAIVETLREQDFNLQKS